MKSKKKIDKIMPILIVIPILVMFGTFIYEYPKLSIAILIFGLICLYAASSDRPYEDPNNKYKKY